MNCYLCDAEGKPTPAVTTCAQCGVGLCRTCLERDVQQPRARGMVRSACGHRHEHAATGPRGHGVAPREAALHA